MSLYIKDQEIKAIYISDSQANLAVVNAVQLTNNAGNPTPAFMRGLICHYDSETDTYIVDGHTNTPAKLVIPAVYNDYIHGEKVISGIGTEAFLNETIIEEVDASAASRNLICGNQAFSGCSNITKISAPTTMAKAIISECGAANGSIELNLIVPSNITSTSTGITFSNNKKLKSVTLSEKFSSISSGAFKGCSYLKTVSINNYENSLLQAINSSAFEGCSSLTTASLVSPKLISIYGSGSTAIFKDCYQLTTLSLSFTGTSRSGNTTATHAFGCIFGTPSDNLTSRYYLANDYYIPSSLKNVTINGLCDPDITYEYKGYIPQNCFKDCQSLRTIHILNYQNDIIGAGALAGCSYLTTLTIPFVGQTPNGSGNSTALFGYIFGTEEFTNSYSAKQYYSVFSTTTYYFPSSLRVVTVERGSIPYGAF